MSEQTQVVLKATNLGALRRLIHETPLDLHVDGPSRHEDGSVTIEAFVTQDDIEAIKAAPEIEVMMVVDLRDRETEMLTAMSLHPSQLRREDRANSRHATNWRVRRGARRGIASRAARLRANAQWGLSQ